MSCLLLIDISSLIYRAHYMLDPECFKRPSDGLANNVVYGVASMLFKLFKNFSKLHKHLYPVACLDSPTCNKKRKEVDSSYKASRPKCPSTMAHQFKWVKQLLQSLHISIAEMENYEADDIIASFCAQQHHVYDNVIIVSPDKDLNQLVKHNINIYNPRLKKIIDEKYIFDKFGVFPKDFTLYQSFIGDKVDGIIGIRGIGPKTAVDIINICHGYLDKFVDEHNDHKSHSKVVSNLETVYRNLKLVTLVCNLITFDDISEFNLNFIKQSGAFKHFLQTMEISSKQLTQYS